MNQELIDSVSDMLTLLKAKDIEVFDVRHDSGITDNMILCTATSSRQVIAIANGFAQLCKEQSIEVFGEEGRETSEWMVIDIGQIFVHIMQTEARELYQLEKLWA